MQRKSVAELASLKRTLAAELASLERFYSETNELFGRKYRREDRVPFLAYFEVRTLRSEVDADGTGVQPDRKRVVVQPNLVRAGVPEAIAKSITGHKTDAVFQRYNITSDADKQDAVSKLDAYRSTRPHTPKVVSMVGHSLDTKLKRRKKGGP